ncbi:MAG TPA: hypothetical protein VFW78_11875 [Bacteroidia bacterium]|nr:hypothetical protein [Bacteroidia bacterium]
MKRKVLFILLSIALSNSLVSAQGGGDPSKLFGNTKMMITGNAEASLVADTGYVNFTDVSFKPIFLWHLSDRLFIEAETEIASGGEGVELVLEYANMCYFINDFLTIHAGRFLPKFGAYRGRMGESFINKFAEDPVGFGDGGIGPMIESGIGLQGGAPLGNSKINYDFWVSNGPNLIDGTEDPENAGQFEYEAYADNNKNKAIGGRVGLLPFSNSSLEVGVSFENASKSGAAYSDLENTGVMMWAADLEYYKAISPIKSTVRLIGEYKSQKVDNAYYPVPDDTTFYTFDNNSSAAYGSVSIRPTASKNKLLRNFELCYRYSEFDRPKEAPWGGDKVLTQSAVALDYWLRWNCLVKLTWNKNSDSDNLYVAQFVYGF